jgi:deazaflavin-dependent oxidoreductase (nitroreductase family)
MSIIAGTKSSSSARAMRAIARATSPLSRPLAGRRLLPLWAVVHHRGRRSGRPYAVPVAIRVTDDAFTIPLPWGDDTQWLRNVLAAGGCSLRWRGESHYAIRPTVVGLDQAADVFSPVQQAILRAAGVRTVLRLERCSAG